MVKLRVDFESEGVVTFYYSHGDDRYALVTPTDGKVAERIYVDRKCMKKSNIGSLSKGVRVKCRGAHKQRGPAAKRVEVIS